MIYFYCQSYQAFNIALAMNAKEEVIIITSSENIIRGCKFLNVKHIVHAPFSPVAMLKQKKLVKHSVNQLIEQIKGHELHFSHTQYAVFSFYLVQNYMLEGGAVVFHDFEFVYKKSKADITNKYYLVAIIQMQVLKLLYGIALELRVTAKNTYVISLKNSFIEKAVSRVIKEANNYYDITLSLFKNIQIPFDNFDNLFIAQTFSNTNFFNEEKINMLMPILNHANVTVKLHPKLNEADAFTNCNYIPTFLPVELFFNKVNKNVISVSSASLITASRFSNICAISLIDLVGNDDGFITEIKNWLIEKSERRILFPKTFSELNLMLHG